MSRSPMNDIVKVRIPPQLEPKLLERCWQRNWMATRRKCWGSRCSPPTYPLSRAL